MCMHVYRNKSKYNAILLDINNTYILNNMIYARAGCITLLRAHPTNRTYPHRVVITP